MANELMHYGVIGMKWGVRKAKSYAADRNDYIRKQKNKEAFKQYKSGNITKKQYVKARLKNRKAAAAKNQKVADRLSKLTPDKEKKVKDIYSKYKNDAINTIPNYKLKKGAKKAGSILLTLGTSSVSVVTSGAIPVGIALNSAGKTAKNFAIKSATKAVEDVAIDAATNFLEKKISKKKGAPKR